jgi:hypothetical protein
MPPLFTGKKTENGKEVVNYTWSPCLQKNKVVKGWARRRYKGERVLDVFQARVILYLYFSFYKVQIVI